MVLACTVVTVAWKREQRAGQQRATEAVTETERKASEARQLAEARQGVTASVALASDLRKQYKFAAASAALKQTAEAAQGMPDDQPMDHAGLARVKRDWMPGDGLLTLGICSRNIGAMSIGGAARGTLTIEMTKKDWGGARAAL